MPEYVFRCPKGHRVAAFTLSIAQKPDSVTCDRCGAEATARDFSDEVGKAAPKNVQVGWYSRTLGRYVHDRADYDAERKRRGIVDIGKSWSQV